MVILFLYFSADFHFQEHLFFLQEQTKIQKY